MKLSHLVLSLLGFFSPHHHGHKKKKSRYLSFNLGGLDMLSHGCKCDSDLCADMTEFVDITLQPGATFDLNIELLEVKPPEGQ